MSFSIPKAMFGRTQAKYRKKVVDVTLWSVLFPTNPEIDQPKD